MVTSVRAASADEKDLIEVGFLADLFHGTTLEASLGKEARIAAARVQAARRRAERAFKFTAVGDLE